MSRDAMKKVRVKLNTVDDTAEIFDKIVSLNITTSGHYCIPICPVADEIPVENVCVTRLSFENPEDQHKILLRLHRQFAHPLEKKFIDLLKDAGSWHEEYKESVMQIYERCDICKQFATTPARPVVALPMDKEFNEMVAIDLKSWRDEVLIKPNEVSTEPVIKNQKLKAGNRIRYGIGESDTWKDAEVLVKLLEVINIGTMLKIKKDGDGGVMSIDLEQTERQHDEEENEEDKTTTGATQDRTTGTTQDETDTPNHAVQETMKNLLCAVTQTKIILNDFSSNIRRDIEIPTLFSSSSRKTYRPTNNEINDEFARECFEHINDVLECSEEFDD
ncbi:hypothetical protein LOTGIDRAFT_165426 [Lottia gigantea]|uniref:Uncharacterized protein n=1 Tax=Lottia gigantea TaxID=225164 RepID=V4A5T8_LOTGI|nr:hypothetical protein LOTGIDRAFT_165426 [Lottia gigantea]ESO88641.1 hypothetical protein LOTGIDRAFT_165426 [Lottia gigantea]